MMRKLGLALPILALLAAFGLPADAQQRATAPSFAASELAQAVASVRPGGRLRLSDVEEEGSSRTSTFLLERFEVFAPDATITIHGKGGSARVLPAPANRYYRGTIEGESDSHVFLAVLADGRVEGIVRRGGQLHFIGDESAPARLSDGRLWMRPVLPWALEPAGGRGFVCRNEDLPASPLSLAEVLSSGETVSAALPATAGGTTPAYTARVAIETDFEFYQLFNSSVNATTYIGNLIGYASSNSYIPEINTLLAVQSISLWPTSSDPWTAWTGQTATMCGLAEFGKYWNANHANISRTTAAFLSGKGLGGGIAWLSKLCSGPFSTGLSSTCPSLGTESTPWGGGYAFIANINGGFNINSPTVMWDIMAVTHEIGHNFSSPHSHCYNGIGGNANPIDQCWNQEPNCYAGATTSLPGPSGQHSGTVMSYCHLVNSSYGDISLSFGSSPFAYGVLPSREAAKINGYVQSIASATCLAPVVASPTISSVAPNRGGTAGGTSVTVTGTNFHQNAVSVTFGGVAGTSPTTSNCGTPTTCTTITVPSPAHATASVDVVVTNTDDSSTATASKSFFYANPSAGLNFYTLPPCRVFDTRNATGPLGGPALGANATRVFQISGNCGVPSTAVSVSGNLTVVAPGAAGILGAFPGNAFPLGTSTLSFVAGVTRANNAVLELATDGSGSLLVFNASGSTSNVVLDVNGYFK